MQYESSSLVSEMLEWLSGNSDRDVLPFLEILVETFKKEGATLEFKIIPTGYSQGNYDIKCMNDSNQYITGISVTPIGRRQYKIIMSFKEAHHARWILHDALIAYGGSLLLEKSFSFEQRYIIYLPCKKRIGYTSGITLAEHLKNSQKPEKKPEQKIEKQPKEEPKEYKGGPKEGLEEQKIDNETPPDVKFADIGGLDNLKKELQYVVWGLSHTEELQQEGCLLPRGILLYGPPGCGKTYLAKALAGETSSLFRSINAGDFWSKWHMEAPRKLKDFFAEAKTKTDKLIIYIDEIDSIAGPRTEFSTAADKDENRLVTVLLAEMDGMEKKNNLLVVGSTNQYNPEKKVFGIDPALLRPGRFDKLLYVPPPEIAARKEILEIHCRRKEEFAGKKLFDTLNTEELAMKTEGKTGADLELLLKETLQKRIQRKIETGQEQSLISQQELLETLATLGMRGRKTEKIGF